MKDINFSKINDETDHQICKLFNEAKILMESGGNLKQAINKYSEILMLDPNNFIALSDIAHCYLLEDKFEKAIDTAKNTQT